MAPKYIVFSSIYIEMCRQYYIVANIFASGDINGYMAINKSALFTVGVMTK